MTPGNRWLIDHKLNKFSQSGEDGIVEKILEVIPSKNGWCVEFGAWDGIYLSNTRNLIVNFSYSAVLIEGSVKRFSELQANYSTNPAVTPLNTLVGYTQSDGLDVILSSTKIPVDFDFLSIDVDGNDYHIWKAISRYRPKVICIEFNPTIPTAVNFAQRAHPMVNQGSSLLAMVELGKTKQYELVCASGANAFFVDAQFFSLFGISDNSLESLWKDLGAITHIFSGFDGTVFLYGRQRLPWHSVPLIVDRIQHLPKCLRKYPYNYNRVEYALFRLFSLWATMRQRLNF